MPFRGLGTHEGGAAYSIAYVTSVGVGGLLHALLTNDHVQALIGAVLVGLAIDAYRRYLTWRETAQRNLSVYQSDSQRLSELLTVQQRAQVQLAESQSRVMELQDRYASLKEAYGRVTAETQNLRQQRDRALARLRRTTELLERHGLTIDAPDFARAVAPDLETREIAPVRPEDEK